MKLIKKLILGTVILSILLLLANSTVSAANQWNLIDAGNTAPKMWLWGNVSGIDGYRQFNGYYYLDAYDVTPDKKRGFVGHPNNTISVDDNGDVSVEYFGKANVNNNNRFNFFAVGNGSVTQGATALYFGGEGITVHRDAGTSLIIYRYDNASGTALFTCADSVVPDINRYQSYKLIYAHHNDTVYFMYNGTVACNATNAGLSTPENFRFAVANVNGGGSGTGMYIQNISYYEAIPPYSPYLTFDNYSYNSTEELILNYIMLNTSITTNNGTVENVSFLVDGINYTGENSTKTNWSVNITQGTEGTYNFTGIFAETNGNFSNHTYFNVMLNWTSAVNTTTATTTTGEEIVNGLILLVIIMGIILFTVFLLTTGNSSFAAMALVFSVVGLAFMLTISSYFVSGITNILAWFFIVLALFYIYSLFFIDKIKQGGRS